MTTQRFMNTLFSLLVLLCASTPLRALAADDSLWVSDDVNVTIYNVALDGTLLSSFHSGSISGLSLSVDPVDGTLWAAKEGSNRIEQYTKAGVKLTTILGQTYDPNSHAPEGVAVDFDDGTLWVVDDFTNLVYNIQRDGTLIRSFPTALYDPAAASPQDITFDPLSGSLWLTDNVTDLIYNVTRDGLLISAFPTSAYSPVATNPQGIGVDMVDGSLWITDRTAQRLFNVTRNGVLLGAIESSVFGSANPTGVSYDRAQVPTLASFKADVAAGIASGKVSAKVKKHFQNLLGQIDKLLAKGKTDAAASMLLGLKDYIVGRIGSGDIDADYGFALAFSAISLSGSLSGS
jgi:hypothetical protein